MVARSEVLEAMIHAGLRAAEGLRSAFGRPEALELHAKGPGDFVSSADLRAQESICRDLSARFPDHGFLCEENTVLEAHRARFIVDPLDGTTNFIRGIPHFAVSIAYEFEETIGAATVIDVMRGETYWAEVNRGAWLGEVKIRASQERDVSRLLVGTGVPHAARLDHSRFLDALGHVTRRVAGVRRFGSAALDLAYVAAGRLDAFFETGLGPWDVAAGSLLVREAGGVVTRPDGKTQRLSGDVLATGGGEVHRVLVESLAPIHVTSDSLR
jgi:myo-inositol-1(or 4)-monophosphatase